jgi:aminoglycoside phosphotransferase (APT) family kinase protein
MDTTEIEVRVASWLATQIEGADDVTVSVLDRDEVGHSAETLLGAISYQVDGSEHCQDIAIRIRPPAPGLLEPYDLHGQFTILGALEGTAVRSPRALWHEPTGVVLGREFYVMERLGGTVYERTPPGDMPFDDATIRRMSAAVVDQIAMIHTVNLRATGLDAIGDGHGYLDRELDHWATEVDRWQQGDAHDLERLAHALRDQQPEQCPTIALVHGDLKVGNFAFEDGEVTAVFDWEMATVGDPLADIGYAEVLWDSMGLFTSHPAALTRDEFVARWSDRTGITPAHRDWYRALAGFKLAAILFVGGKLYDAGHTQDERLRYMGLGVPIFAGPAAVELGIDAS